MTPASISGRCERPDIFIIAGEQSGDLIGSRLIKQILKRKPEAKICGLGGDQMAEAGAEILVDTVRDFAIIGLFEVLRNIHKIRRLFNDTLAHLQELQPRVLVLIDYPGFNLRIARKAHEMGIKIVYYVIPQIWAWHKSRIHQIRKYVVKALVIFPFEETMLQDAGIDVEYVGHPLLDVMILTMNRDEVFEKFNLDPEKKLIGLLPGSRKREIDTLLPVMLGAAERIQRQIPQVQFVLPRASNIRREQIDRHIRDHSVKVDVVDSFRYNIRSAMDFAIVASGTATLETGLLQTPMVILYRVATPTWMVGRLLVNLPYIGLINIVAGERVVPELLQDQCTAEHVAERSLKILSNPGEMERIREKLARVKEKMGGRGASRRAAENVVEICWGNQPAP